MVCLTLQVRSGVHTAQYNWLTYFKQIPCPGPKAIQMSGNNRSQSKSGQHHQAQSTLRSAPGVPRGGGGGRGHGGPAFRQPSTQNDIYDTMEEETYDTMDDDDRDVKPKAAYGTQRGGGSFNPGPPRGPVPSQQPSHRPKVKLNRNRG